MRTYTYVIAPDFWAPEILATRAQNAQLVAACVGYIREMHVDMRVSAQRRGTETRGLYRNDGWTLVDIATEPALQDVLRRMRAYVLTRSTR